MLQISCVEKSGYYTESENRIIDLICDITWMSEKTTNDKGMTYQDVYKFSKNGTYARTLIATDKMERNSKVLLMVNGLFLILVLV